MTKILVNSNTYNLKRKNKIMNLLNLNNEEFTNFINKNNIIYSYFNIKNRPKVNDIRTLYKYYNKLPSNINYPYLSNNVLPTLYKLSALSYNSNLFNSINYLNKYKIKINNNLFILFKINRTLFVFIRGSKYKSELKKATTESNRVKYRFYNKNTHNKFLKWKINFLNDFNKNKKDFTNVPDLIHTNIYIHKNYYKKSNSICLLLSKVINKYNINNVILSGHSMGGSLASICGIRLKDQYRNKIKLNIISFSNLAIGNRNLSLFSIYLNINSYIRVYNSNDIVGKLRTGILFKPFGRLRHLNHSITKKYNNYIIIDIDKFIPNSLRKKIDKLSIKNKKYIYHILYKFNKNKYSNIFI